MSRNTIARFWASSGVQIRSALLEQFSGPVKLFSFWIAGPAACTADLPVTEA